MILSSRETCIAYRCPYCGTGVKSMVGVFSLSGAVKKLKCDCGSSELKITQLRDGKLRISAPCIFCMTEHSFVISSKLFFDKELFVYPCPYSAIDMIFIGTPEAVSAALDKSEQEFIKMLRDSGIDDLDRLHGELDRDDDETPIDSSLYDAVMFTIRELIDSGEVSCCCDDGDYDVAVSDDHVKVFCRNCGASCDIPTDSELAVRAFELSDHLKLEKL